MDWRRPPATETGEKRRIQRTPTLDAAAKVLEQMQPGWRRPKRGQRWSATLEIFAFPRLGALAISAIVRAVEFDTLRRI